MNEDLALRRAHIREKEAQLKAAKAQEAQAKLNLERTRPLSPFDALVLEENIEPGSFVSAQSSLLRLAGRDTFHIVVKLPYSALKDFDFEAQLDVFIYRSGGAEETGVRRGRFVRTLPDLAEQGRMARILIGVDQPLEPENGSPKIFLNSFVRVELYGKALSDIVRIPRKALRENDEIWLRDKEGKLQKEKVRVLFSDGDDIFLKAENLPGKELITSSLGNALSGMLLEVENPEEKDG